MLSLVLFAECSERVNLTIKLASSVPKAKKMFMALMPFKHMNIRAIPVLSTCGSELPCGRL